MLSMPYCEYGIVCVPKQQLSAQKAFYRQIIGKQMANLSQDIKINQGKCKIQFLKKLVANEYSCPWFSYLQFLNLSRQKILPFLTL